MLSQKSLKSSGSEILFHPFSWIYFLKKIVNLEKAKGAKNFNGLQGSVTFPKLCFSLNVSVIFVLVLQFIMGK